MPNRNRSSFLTLTAVVAGLLAGCATPTWDATPGTHHSEKTGLTLDVPSGWSRYGNPLEIVLTRDGFLLNLIRINRTPYGEKYGDTELTLRAEISQLDASQLVVESMQADQKRRNLVLIDNQPVTVAGHPGFRVEISYRNEDNLTVHEIIYVALIPEAYLVALCRAPERHYIEAVSGDFERIVASLRVDPDPDPATD